jgi:YesN/AraC family two-component response regulator
MPDSLYPPMPRFVIQNPGNALPVSVKLISKQCYLRITMGDPVDTMAFNILLVDDDKEFREEFRDFLCDYNVLEASDGKEALVLLSQPNEIDLVILDVVMPGPSGTEILKRIKEMYPDMGVIILTGYGTKGTVIDALKGKADDYMEKPIDIHKTRDIIDRLIQERMPTGEAPPGGQDAKIAKVMHFIDRNYDKRLSLKEAAGLVALSPKYFSRIFKVKTGIGFSEYRLKVRIKKAAELLESTDYTIDEISFRVGYENAESFTRLFKKVRGCSPTQHRKACRTRKPGKISP